MATPSDRGDFSQECSENLGVLTVCMQIVVLAKHDHCLFYWGVLRRSFHFFNELCQARTLYISIFQVVQPDRPKAHIADFDINCWTELGYVLRLYNCVRDGAQTVSKRELTNSLQKMRQFVVRRHTLQPNQKNPAFLPGFNEKRKSLGISHQSAD
ncbi:hypothetical protein [Rhizobium sp. Leaf262]|uniref:hypothetical protein n=1 Tax=Rhizobium sp. Leaf262 TaxID=1736312 RepID=UPI0012E85CA4|nr:hypothetical protein [Rhizobium sp. Leaf262]